MLKSADPTGVNRLWESFQCPPGPPTGGTWSEDGGGGDIHLAGLAGSSLEPPFRSGEQQRRFFDSPERQKGPCGSTLCWNLCFLLKYLAKKAPAGRLSCEIYVFRQNLWPKRSLLATKSEAYVVPKTKYLTLAPKFYNFSVLSPRRCFCFVNPYLLTEIAAQHLDHTMAVSNHVLKPSGAFVWKLACDLGFAGYVFLGLFAMRRQS